VKANSLTVLVLLMLCLANGVVMTVGQAASVSTPTTTSPANSENLKITTPWHDTIIKLVVSGTSGPAANQSKVLDIPAKTAIYQGAIRDSAKMLETFSTVVFFDPNTKKSCVVKGNYSGEQKGSNQMFYISGSLGVTSCSIVGGSLWLDKSYIELAAVNPDLDQAITRFESEYNPKMLSDRMFHLQPINLRPAKDPWFFYSKPSDSVPDLSVSINSIDVVDSVLHLDLTNPLTKHSAAFWIDLRIRKIIRATEDGKETDPRTPMSFKIDNNGTATPIYDNN